MSDNKKQDSIEWFARRLDEAFLNYQRDKITTAQYILESHRLEEEAKDMQKKIRLQEHSYTWTNAVDAVKVDKWENFLQYYVSEHGDQFAGKGLSNG